MIKVTITESLWGDTVTLSEKFLNKHEIPYVKDNSGIGGRPKITTQMTGKQLEKLMKKLSKVDKNAHVYI